MSLAILSAVALAAAQVAAPDAVPTVSNRAVATFSEGEVEIHGSGFGSPAAGHDLLFQSGANWRAVASTDPLVQIWEDDRIVAILPAGAPSGRLWVRTPSGRSAKVEIHVFDYRSYDIPPTSGTNALPLSVEVDHQGRVWVNQEFHLEFQMLDIGTGVVTGLPIPKPPNPGPFASTIFGDHRTQTSALGEDVLVDPHGRVWFTQGGGYLYSGIHPNHSRVVCYDPAAPAGSEWRVYNVPGDWNEVMGLAWDPLREWVWFTNGGLDSGAKIAGFDPEKIPFDNHFDFSTSLLHQVCTPGAPTDPCYHVYFLPNPTAQPAHLLVDGQGMVWYTAYWGRAIGRLDPTTSAVTEYPVPDPVSTTPPSFIVGAGPWEIVQAPNGDIVFNEFFDATISRFDVSRADDPACQQLDPGGRNPCIRERIIPAADHEKEQVHSLAYDLEGNLWYTIHTEDDPALNGSLGFLTADGSTLTRLPPLSRFAGAGAASAAGVAVDPVSGDVWFCEFWRKRIGRLSKVPEL